MKKIIFALVITTLGACDTVERVRDYECATIFQDSYKVVLKNADDEVKTFVIRENGEMLVVNYDKTIYQKGERVLISVWENGEARIHSRNNSLCNSNP